MSLVFSKAYLFYNFPEGIKMEEAVKAKSQVLTSRQ